MSAASIENIQGPVHEAFLTPVGSAKVNEAVPTTPPDMILERVPERPGSDVVWIPGYWQFNTERNDYIWISGVWRQPPPKKQWINGYWQKFDEGWVWISGFWSGENEEDLSFITATPPDSLEEDTGVAPGDNYFWAPGYWTFDDNTHDFNWVSGSWVMFDPNWILVPAYYVWRTTGYVLVNSYWDWSLEKRGTAYTGLFVPPSERRGYIYEPVVKVEPLTITRHYFNLYPDYIYFYNHNYHYFSDVWSNWDIAPPWWGWKPWWSFNWSNNWALWWWWGHPGYPAPGWMSKSLAQQIAPPSKAALKQMQYITPPAIVTPKGVVAPNLILDAVNEKQPRTKRKPVLPYNRKSFDEIAERMAAEPKKDLADIRPSGKVAPVPAHLNKPKIVDKQAIPNKVSVPVPAKPGAPSVLRPKPTTPGSNIKPAIPRAVFTPRVPNLRPSQDRALNKDVFVEPSVSGSRSDRSSVHFEAPYQADRPPYNNPTRIIRSSEPASNYAPLKYDAPNFSSKTRDYGSTNNIYDIPQASRAIILQKEFGRGRKNETARDPFNPQGRAPRKSDPSFIPPRPDAETPSELPALREKQRELRNEARENARELNLKDDHRRDVRQRPSGDEGKARNKGPDKKLADAEQERDLYLIAAADEDPTLIFAAKKQQTTAAESSKENVTIPIVKKVSPRPTATPKMVTPVRDPNFRKPVAIRESELQPKKPVLFDPNLVPVPEYKVRVTNRNKPETPHVMTKSEQLQSLLSKQKIGQEKNIQKKIAQQRFSNPAQTVPTQTPTAPIPSLTSDVAGPFDDWKKAQKNKQTNPRPQNQQRPQPVQPAAPMQQKVAPAPVVPPSVQTPRAPAAPSGLRVTPGEQTSTPAAPSSLRVTPGDQMITPTPAVAPGSTTSPGRVIVRDPRTLQRVVVPDNRSYRDRRRDRVDNTYRPEQPVRHNRHDRPNRLVDETEVDTDETSSDVAGPFDDWKKAQRNQQRQPQRAGSNDAFKRWQQSQNNNPFNPNQRRNVVRPNPQPTQPVPSQPTLSNKNRPMRQGEPVNPVQPEPIQPNKNRPMRQGGPINPTQPVPIQPQRNI